jgi:hypothetical protein
MSIKDIDPMDAHISALDHSAPGFQLAYAKALNHIHQTVDQSSLKDELVSYAARLGRGTSVDSIPANRVSVEGKIAYCLNRGANLSPSSIKRLDEFIETKQTVDDDAPAFEELPETARSRAIQAYVSCYSLIDNAKARVLSGKLQQRELAGEIRRIIQNKGLGKSSITRQLLDHYKQSYLEAVADPTIKGWVKPLATITETIGFMLNNRASIKAGARGAKARKMSSTADQVDRKGEKAASKVSYKDEDDKLGIRSVDPTNLVGADAAVVFNTKTRHCEVYMAKQGSKLSVQGARIVNFDEAVSTGRTIRKPEVDLQHWVRASTIRRLEVLIKGIKGKSWEVTGKLNKNCVIVKVL